MSKIIEKVGPKERRFLDALRDLFVGAKVDGESGYINLMSIKASYFTGLVEPTLMEDIAAALKEFPEFREEMFDKLHAFFSRYFSRNGSICFAYTPNHFNVYERVYTDEQDVALFWKTHMLYYVKTDTLFQDLKVEIDGETFFFDCSKLQHKKANEKRQTIHTFDKVEKDDTIRLAVTYSENGRKTKVEDTLKALKKAGHPVKEATLEKAIRVFERQRDVDYFINKNAKAFLREQFDLWMYHYMFRDETHWTEGRIQELQALKNIAFKIIDFIAQFEDELVRVWNKPKFVRDSHYVVTLDRLAEKEGGLDVIAALVKHKGMTEQIAEWIDLGIMKKGFDPKTILERNGKKKTLAKDWQFLPVDTKYFANLELKLIGLFDNLDEELDGRLIKSENYQALLGVAHRWARAAKAIYIDPPFNKASEANYEYNVKYKDSTWLTLLQNRIEISKQLLKDGGFFLLRCDQNGNFLARSVLDNEFGKFGFKNQLSVRRVKKNITEQGRAPMPEALDTIFVYERTESAYSDTSIDHERAGYWRRMDDSAGERNPPNRVIFGKRFSPPPGKHFKFNQTSIEKMIKEGRIRIRCDNGLFVTSEEDWKDDSMKFNENSLPQYFVPAAKTKNLDTFWSDIYGYSFDWGFQTENSEKLLSRILKVTTDSKDLVIDFFLGSGTTCAVAHKSGRKWIGVDIGAHFESIIVPRLKLVLSGEERGVSRDLSWIGGGFFKYYHLEQYEDVFSAALYSGDEGDLFHNTKKDPYTQYVFLRDEKQSQVLELDYENDEVNVDLTRLYPDIDLAETLSCAIGKRIKRITKDEVEFADGSKESLVKPKWGLLKPLIFWGPAE